MDHHKPAQVFLLSLLGLLFIPVIIAQEFVKKLQATPNEVGFNPWRQIIKEKPQKNKFYF